MYASAHNTAQSMLIQILLTLINSKLEVEGEAPQNNKLEVQDEPYFPMLLSKYHFQI